MVEVAKSYEDKEGNLIIPVEEVAGVVERVREIFKIREKANFHFATGERLDTPWKELRAIIDMLDLQMK